MYLSSGRGSAIIERRVAGVYIRRASGTTDPDLFAKIQAMLDEIDEAGRDDLARMVADGQIKAVVLLHSFRRQGLSLKLSPERALPLKTAIEVWLKRETAKRARNADDGLDPKTCEDYGYALNAVLKGHPNATAADLPALLGRYRHRAKARMFNLARSASQSFIRENVADGRYSELWAQVSKNRTRKVKRKKGNPQPVERARLIAEALGRYGAMWWTMCCTGMGKKEYWTTPWEVLPDRIAIHGTKDASRAGNRDRVVPRILTPVQAHAHHRTFEAALKQAVLRLKLGRVTLYDGRRTFAHWLEMAGIPKSRRDTYLGHAPADMSGLYEEHPVEYYLAEDARKLQGYVGSEFTALKVVG